MGRVPLRKSLGEGGATPSENEPKDHPDQLEGRQRPYKTGGLLAATISRIAE